MTANKKRRGQPAERKFGGQLVIDDQRTLSDKDLVSRGPVTYARTFDEAKLRLYEAMTYKRPPWDVIYVEHDLGDYIPGHIGIDLLRWVLAYSLPDRLPRVVRVITMNYTAKPAMEAVANDIMALRRDCVKGG